MFNRVAYKKIAKQQLQGRWFTPVIATLLTILIMSGLGASVRIILFVAAAVLNIANVHLFITLSHTKEKQSLSVFIQGFSRWLDGLLSLLWFTLWVILWSIFFIIPGFVKAYSYSQMFFIIAEYPDMDVRKAMNLSKKLTKGYKLDLFIMNLSFIGWLILSGFTGGILLLWVIPYMFMTNINAYHSIKQQALDAGIVTNEDFGVSESDNTSDTSSTSASSTTNSANYNWDTSNAVDAETVNTEALESQEPILLGDGTDAPDSVNPNFDNKENL